MRTSCAALLFVAGITAISCSRQPSLDPQKEAEISEPLAKAQNERERDELRPSEDQIAEDSVAFVRSTKVMPARTRSADCPGCAGAGSEVFSFRNSKTDAVTCSGSTCTVVVTLHVVFNPGSGETVAGGLTAWISPEQRSAYLAGETPADEQLFRVQITYKRRGQEWRAVEFDRAPSP